MISLEKATSLLVARSIPVADFLSVYVPTVGEILFSDDREYYQTVTTLISTPYDLMVQLDDMGIDYEQITDFELFMLLFQSLQHRDLSLIFPGLDSSLLRPAKNKENGQTVLWDSINGIVIDELVYNEICDALRKIHFTEKPKYKAGNKEAKKFLIERTRLKQKRQAKKPYRSFLEDLVVAMVNTEEFKYNYQETMDLTIYQFNASVRQIQRKINYNHVMSGCYFGTVDIKKIDQRELNWLTQE